MTTTTYPFYVRLCLTLVSIYFLGLLIYKGSDILMPLSFAIVLAMLLLPVVNWLIRKRIPGVLSIILAILLATLFAGGILYFLSSQIASFMDDLPAIKEKLGHHISTFQTGPDPEWKDCIPESPYRNDQPMMKGSPPCRQ